MASALLEVKDLRVSFFGPQREATPVCGVSFSVEPGRLLGLVGESGSGKTVAMLAIMRLLPDNARIAAGSIRLDGVELTALGERQMRSVRGARIAMVFQEPMTSLNPVMRVGDQIGEAIKLHQRCSPAQRREQTIEALRLVGIADPERRVRNYPHELSGGMRQRVMIAMALACRPRLLIADEPTTALDVTIQAQILELLRELQQKLGLAVILVTHDLGVVANYADDVTILYAGKVMEQAAAGELFATPLHPYTQALLRAMPGLAAAVGGRLEAIPGQIPDSRNLPPGCRFAPRCSRAIAECSLAEPPLEAKKAGHYVACIRV